MSVARKVVVAGMHRSGTTWLFNTVREGVQASGLTLHSGFGSEVDWGDPADVVVQKLHRGAVPEGAVVVMMKRDLRGVAASAMRMGLVDEDDVISYLRTCVEQEDKPFRPLASLRMAYEDMMADKVAATARVLRVLGLDADARDVHRRVEGLRIPDEGHDPETQLHAGHVTSGVPWDWRPLSARAVRAIEGAFGAWLARNGYSVGALA